MRPILALAVAVILGATVAGRGASYAGAASMDDRTHAQHSLADIRASMAEIVRIEDGDAVGHEPYIMAAERARNALLGHGDRDYIAAAGDPSDGVGAIGHIDALLDRTGSSSWTPALQGAKINLLAAVQSLANALQEKQMEDYENDLSVALADISLAIGRTSDIGVFGGIEGALASTTLGIPSGSRVISGCASPKGAPSYGVTAGRLAFVSLPRATKTIDLPQHLDVRRIGISSDRIVLFTGTTSEVSALCGRAPGVKRRATPSLQLALAAASPDPNAVASGAPASNAASHQSTPSYTVAQAHAGAGVYAQNCASCHAANLQGSAGPAVAGTEFLKSVQTNGWTYADFRNIVVQQMPLNNPGTLTAKQYADVLSFLLASSCFPAGSAPFPQADDPKLAAAKIAPPAAGLPGDTKLGTCTAK